MKTIYSFSFVFSIIGILFFACKKEENLIDPYKSNNSIKVDKYENKAIAISDRKLYDCKKRIGDGPTKKGTICVYQRSNTGCSGKNTCITSKFDVSLHLTETEYAQWGESILDIGSVEFVKTHQDLYYQFYLEGITLHPDSILAMNE